MRAFVLLAIACSTAASAPAPRGSATLAGHPARDRATPVALARAPETSAPRLGDPASPGQIVAARVVAAVDGGVATDRPVHARRDQAVALHALIEVRDRGRVAWFCDAPRVRLAGRALRVQPIARAPALALAWNRVEPAAASYSNTDETGFHFTPIDYRTTAIEGARGPSLRADVRPTLTPDHGHGVGTMRFQVVAMQGTRTIASPGPEARRGRGSGGLTDAVMRVSIRRDDTYLGYLTELYGQPYIWASAGRTDATHQTERLEGADCADFVVYGARRMGKHVKYTWTGGLPAVTRLLAAGTRAADGIYRDARGKPLPFTRAGDLILFTRHVGVLTRDLGTPGVLDDHDLVMHALFDTPKEQAIADTGYADTPVELRRWK